jgi:hypothetical protein
LLHAAQAVIARERARAETMLAAQPSLRASTVVDRSRLAPDWTPPEGAPGPERTLDDVAELKQAACSRR